MMSDPSPEEIVYDELYRLESPDRHRDAVLVLGSGRNLTLYVVKRGQSVHNRPWALVLIHVGESVVPSMSWSDQVSIRIEADFEEIAPHSSRVIVERPGKAVVIKL